MMAIAAYSRGTLNPEHTPQCDRAARILNAVLP